MYLAHFTEDKQYGKMRWGINLLLKNISYMFDNWDLAFKGEGKGREGGKERQRQEEKGERWRKEETERVRERTNWLSGAVYLHSLSPSGKIWWTPYKEHYPTMGFLASWEESKLQICTFSPKWWLGSCPFFF